MWSRDAVEFHLVRPVTRVFRGAGANGARRRASEEGAVECEARLGHAELHPHRHLRRGVSVTALKMVGIGSSTSRPRHRDTPQCGTSGNKLSR